VTKHIVVNRDVTWLDWNRLNPARNLSIFKIEPDLLREMGIDDEELPVTVDDRAINIIPMGDEDDDSVAGRMEPYFKMNRQMLQQSFKTPRHSGKS
jgi:hypothetical protein